MTGVSRMHLAIARSAEPTSLDPSDWCSYTFDTKTSANGVAAWSDFPSIGAGKDTVAISTNAFEFTADERFRYAEVRAFNKNTAIDNATSCPSLPLFRWTPASTAGDTKILNLTPAQQTKYPSSFKGTKNPLYLLSTETGVPGSPFVSNRLHVWRIRNMSSGNPTISGKTIKGSWTYASSPWAEQPGGPLLATGAQKVTGLVSRGNTLYGVFNSACTVGVSPPFESCIVLAKVGVGQNLKGKMTAKLKQEFGATYGADTFIWMPSIAVTSAGVVFVTAQASDDSVLFGGLRAIGMRQDGSTTSFQPWFPITPEGECPTGIADGTRTGDYTATVLDPNDPTKVWMAGEYSKDFGATGCWWGTTIVHATP